MRRERGEQIGERLEGGIRAWVRARDAGPAPERLRMRIARVAEAERAPRRGFRAMLRPAVLLASAAAAAGLVLLAVGLRVVPGHAGLPGAGSTPSGGPTPTASPAPLPAMPVGPWPRTGSVLAVPLDGPLLVAVACLSLIVALLILARLAALTVAEARRAEPDQKWSWFGLWHLRARRTRLRRGLAVLVAAVLIAVGCGLFQFAQTTPLTYGPSFAGGTLGSRIGTGGGAGEAYEAFVPGGQLDLDISLANDGDLPLTVTSFDQRRFLSEQPAGAYISSVEFRLPPGASYECVSPEESYPMGLCTQPFHPFELLPKNQTVLTLIVHLKNCRSVMPGPSPAPGATTNQNYLPTTGYVTFGELPFRYSVLGIERETNVAMFEAVGLVFGSNVVKC